MSKKACVYLTTSLLATLVFLSPNLYNDFLNWDDPTYVTQNPLIKNLTIEGVVDIFSTKKVLSTYSPLVLLSWSLDYAIFGLNPFIFHLTNLLLHLMVVTLIFYLSFLLSKSIEVAFVTSILFGIHPMHVEAVGWISARKDLLYTLFFIVGLLFYCFYIEKKAAYKKKYYYLGCILFYILSLLSKGTAVIFPLVLFLFDYLKGREYSKQIILEKIPFLILSICFFLLAIDGQASSGAMEDRQFVSFFDSIAVGFYGYLSYFIKSVVPFQLSPYHPYPNDLSEPFPWYFYASAIPVLALFILIVIKAKTSRVLGFCIAFFFVTLIPVIQVLPFGTAVISERYTYLPYFGLFFLLGVGFVHLITENPNFKKTIITVGCGYIVSLGVITFQYSSTFKNTETFWTKVMTQYPQDFLSYMNMTNYKISKGRYGEALKDANKAISLKPESYILYFNRGFVFEAMGELNKAIVEYSKSIKMYPKFYSNYANRGILYFKRKRYNLAIRDFTNSIKLSPKNPGGYYNRAMVYQRIGELNKALLDINQLIALNFDLRNTLYSRARVYAHLDMLDKSILDLTKVIKLRPKYISAFMDRGNIFIEKRNFLGALQDFEEIIRIDHNVVDAHINKGLVLMNMNKFEEALFSFNEAQSLTPNNHLIYFNRGILYKKLNNFKLAFSNFETCSELAPDFEPAKIEKEKMKLLF
ncbi:tetratricopeptide repeat protein [Aquimarina sp. M1]